MELPNKNVQVALRKAPPSSEHVRQETAKFNFSEVLKVGYILLHI